MLNLWLQRPSLNMDVLNGRHQAVELFTKSEISSTIKDIKSSLSHIKNIARVLNRVRGNQANPNEWQQLLQVRSIIARNAQNAMCMPQSNPASGICKPPVCLLLSAHPHCCLSTAFTARCNSRTNLTDGNVNKLHAYSTVMEHPVNAFL